MVFVGGRYQEKHDNVFRLFFLNVTETTKISSQGYVMWHLFVAVLSALIVFCQIGFALLQSGASRKGSVVIPFGVNILNIGVICPFIIHWAWHYSGWMLKYTIGLGVQNQDIGGSGPVHAVGGAAALVVTLVLGSRDEKIRRKGQRGIVYDMEGHSVPVIQMQS